MYWPIVGFAIGMLVVAAYLAAAGFHVFKYRYRNDASMPVFVLACLLFFIITVFVFSEFDWRDNTAPTQSSINNSLL